MAILCPKKNSEHLLHIHQPQPQRLCLIKEVSCFLPFCFSSCINVEWLKFPWSHNCIFRSFPDNCICFEAIWSWVFFYSLTFPPHSENGLWSKNLYHNFEKRQVTGHGTYSSRGKKWTQCRYWWSLRSRWIYWIPAG